ncbi:hypothetical protein AAK706_05265 [Erysipelotrichaceae bacterium 66-17]
MSIDIQRRCDTGMAQALRNFQDIAVAMHMFEHGCVEYWNEENGTYRPSHTDLALIDKVKRAWKNINKR